MKLHLHHRIAIALVITAAAILSITQAATGDVTWASVVPRYRRCMRTPMPQKCYKQINTVTTSGQCKAKCAADTSCVAVEHGRFNGNLCRHFTCPPQDNVPSNANWRCWSKVVEEEEAPPAPINLVAVPSAGATCLSWSMRPGAPNAASYSIKAIPVRNTQGAQGTMGSMTNGEQNVKAAKFNAPMFTKVDRLQNGFEYKFTVLALTAGGRMSEESFPVTAAPIGWYPPCGDLPSPSPPPPRPSPPPPSPPPPRPPPPSRPPSRPLNVHVNPGNRKACLWWDEPESDNGSPVTGYSVMMTPSGPPNSQQKQSMSESVETTAQASGLFNGYEYKVQVVAFNEFGSSQKSIPVYVSPKANLPDDPCTLPLTPPNEKCEATGYPCGGLMYTGDGECCTGQCVKTNAWLSLCVRYT